MKTRKEWEHQNKDLSEFLSIGDVIDERLYNYIGEVVVPAYWNKNFVQCGDPERHEGRTSFHMTACFQNGKCYYLGILPLFK